MHLRPLNLRKKPAEDVLKQKMNDGTNTSVLDEKAPFVEEDPDDLFENGVRLWDSPPDEIVDQILIYATKNSDEVLCCVPARGFIESSRKNRTLSSLVFTSGSMTML